MRIVIFGCGYVGRALANLYSAEDCEVWIHSRNRESLDQVDSVPDSRKISGDLDARDWHGTLTGHWDLVFNLVSSAGGGLDGYRKSYLEGNRSIREWAGKVKAERLIYTSATSVYPQSDGQWVDEDSVPVDPVQLSSSGRILREAEMEVLVSPVFPVRVVARLAGIYGPGRHLYLDRLRDGAGALPGDGSHWLNLIYRDDIVSALVQLGTASLPGNGTVVNVVDDTPTRKQAIVDWLAQELGIDPIPFDPALAAMRSSRRQTASGLPNRRVANALLKELTGWRPRYGDFRAGYRAILGR